jgi:hypothetical protein
MAIQNFIPELWSTQLLVAFRNSHVFANLVNRNYEGEIRRAGDTVKITTPGAISVGAYSGTVTYETPLSAQQSLLIDQDVYWAFDIDDVDAAQANVDLMGAYMQEAAYSLAQYVDDDLAGLYTAAGLTSISLDVGTDDHWAKLTLAAQQLDEANVPREGRWYVVTPKGYANLLATDEFVHATEAGDRTIAMGEVGEAAGFRVFKSNNLTNTTGNTYAYMYGQTSAITWAGQVLNTEAVRRDASFADGMRGRLVYGRKVVRPSALGVVLADQT